VAGGGARVASRDGSEAGGGAAVAAPCSRTVDGGYEAVQLRATGTCTAGAGDQAAGPCGWAAWPWSTARRRVTDSRAALAPAGRCGSAQ